MNICTLKFIKQAGYTEADIISEVITIKAYDNLERTTEGTILLPIKVGPVIQEPLCHVIDRSLFHLRATPIQGYPSLVLMHMILI
ncbi:hypothetical protein P3S38_28745, partial [Enterobacter hormaechei]|uniref:hypothetical protein n=1 Tax=Enterobacter hormaechei TaxID=158836 RepID=UPI0023E368BB